MNTNIFDFLSCVKRCLSVVSNRTLLLFLLFAITNVDFLSAQTGISNHGENKDQPYVTAGDRAYLIGTQDGNFPDMGGHVPGEMGGLWLHPIKLIDGFWVNITDTTTNQGASLSQAIEFVNYPYGNLFRYGPVLDGIEIERFQFSPDGQPGLIVQYKLKNAGNRKKELNFQFSVQTDLIPVWFSDQLGIKDAQDTVAWDSKDKLFIATDTGNKWVAVWGSSSSKDGQPIEKPHHQQTSGKGVAAASQYHLSISKNSSSTLTFILAGSTTDKNQALSAFKYLASNHASLLEKKEKHYASILERARIKIPDPSLQQVYDWVKVNCEWLVREVPGIGRGLGGGLMEYPWWFGTETYSMQALMATGDFALVKDTLRLLKTQSMKANGNGRIVHEISTNGGISNPGNTQETAQFIITVGKLFEWTGDLDFAKEMYPMMKMGINWLLKEMDQNKNLFPEGYGIMEVYGLNAELIDVSVYTQKALKATSRIADVLNEPDAAKQYRQIASRIRKENQ